jgi:thiamine-phosphate diphosphorylase
MWHSLFQPTAFIWGRTTCRRTGTEDFGRAGDNRLLDTRLTASRAAARLPIDYIAAGPVFATRTKENPDDTIGLDTIKNIRRAIGSFPLVAIGGINSVNFRDVLNAGAGSVALISDLIAAPDKISKKVEEFLFYKPLL